jgi:hypothetical protein
LRSQRRAVLFPLYVAKVVNVVAVQQKEKAPAGNACLQHTVALRVDVKAADGGFSAGNIEDDECGLGRKNVYAPPITAPAGTLEVDISTMTLWM